MSQPEPLSAYETPGELLDRMQSICFMFLHFLAEAVDDERKENLARARKAAAVDDK